MFTYEHAVPGKMVYCTCKQSTAGIGLIASQYHQRWQMVPTVVCIIVFHHIVTDILNT